MSQTTTIEQAEVAPPLRDLHIVEDAAVSKGFILPELLTLTGLYHTTKTLYQTYVPESAASVIKGVSATIFKASSPLVIKAIPESASTEWKCLETGDLQSIDNLLLSYFVAGDVAIHTIVNDTKARATSIYTTHKENFSTKVDSWVESIVLMKNFLLEKVEGVKPEINSKLDSAKAAVQAKLDDEKVVALMDQAKPYINLVKENVDPAKDLLSEMATQAKAEVDAKGYVGYAKESAGSIREQSIEAFETCKTLGAVKGVKEISNQVINNVATKLEDAKRKKQPPMPAAEVVVEAAAEPEEEKFTSASEDDTN